jgi:hypothetical protein
VTTETARRSRSKKPTPIGGGWYRLRDGSKIQGRVAAYEAAGLDPSRVGNRRSDAAQQRRRQTQIDDRRATVASLLVQKVPYVDIARIVDVSLGTVAADVKEIRAEWKRQQSDDIEEYVIEELRTLDSDEYDLRLRWQAVGDDRLKVRIYDRILRLRAERRRLLGLDAPTVTRHVLTPDEEEGFGGETAVFRAGGTKREFLEAIQGAMGYPKLEAVK